MNCIICDTETEVDNELMLNKTHAIHFTCIDINHCSNMLFRQYICWRLGDIDRKLDWIRGHIAIY